MNGRCAAVLAFFLIAPAAAQAPDFTALVRDEAAAVVNLSGGLRPVLPDLPLAEDGEEEEEGDLMREFLRRYFGPAPELRSLGSGFVIDASG